MKVKDGSIFSENTQVCENPVIARMAESELDPPHSRRNGRRWSSMGTGRRGDSESDLD
jgi:hypothetical protein